MRVLFDTSVLVAAMVEQHPLHLRAFPWLKRAREREIDACVTTHSLAELYAVLTALPVRPKITPGMARRLVRENVEKVAQIEAMTQKDYQDVLDSMAELELRGGIVYDALAAKIAQRWQAEALLTFNAKDFRRAWPGGAEVIQEP